MYKVKRQKGRKLEFQKSGIRLKTAICYLLVVGCYLLPVISHAQCAMCRAVLETEEGTQKAEAVNDGIVYLMVFPYLLVGILAIVIYRVYNKKKKINNAN